MQLKNRQRWLNAELQWNFNQRGRFLKNVLIFEKKGGCWPKFGLIRNRLSRTVRSLFCCFDHGFWPRPWTRTRIFSWPSTWSPYFKIYIGSCIFWRSGGQCSVVTLSANAYCGQWSEVSFALKLTMDWPRGVHVPLGIDCSRVLS